MSIAGRKLNSCPTHPPCSRSKSLPPPDRRSRNSLEALPQRAQSGQHCAPFSPLKTGKQQNKMSILLPLVQRCLWWQMSPSRRCPSIALVTVFLQSCQRRGERGQSHNRRKSQDFAHSNTTQKPARSLATRRFDPLFESKRIYCDNISRGRSTERMANAIEIP